MNQKVISAAMGAALVVSIGGTVFSTSSARGTPPAPTPAATEQAASSSEAAPATTGMATVTPREVSTPPKPGIAVGEPNSSAPAPKPSGITAAEVAQHSSREDCWSTINSTVYDLTSWIPNHPGGERAILQLCGTDGSAKFNGKHGGDSRKATVLAGFKVGAAAQ